MEPSTSRFEPRQGHGGGFNRSHTSGSRPFYNNNDRSNGQEFNRAGRGRAPKPGPVIKFKNDLDTIKNTKNGVGHKLGSVSEVTPKRLADEKNWLEKQYFQMDRWSPKIYPLLKPLFEKFNKEYFNGELISDRVDLNMFWGMKSKIGVGYTRVYYRYGIRCAEIELSDPSLNGEMWKDVVEAILHEMIHAWLFFKNGERGRHHSAEFVKKMHEINIKTGANVSTYHATDAQVQRVIAKFIWRCNGRCQHKGPYFGWLKRSEDIPPSTADPWFAEHQQSCEGNFERVTNFKHVQCPTDVPENYGHPMNSNGDIPTIATNNSAVVNKVRSGPVVPFTGKGFTLGGTPKAISGYVRSVPLRTTGLDAGPHLRDILPTHLANIAFPQKEERKPFVPFGGKGYTFD